MLLVALRWSSELAGHFILGCCFVSLFLIISVAPGYIAPLLLVGLLHVTKIAKSKGPSRGSFKIYMQLYWGFLCCARASFLVLVLFLASCFFLLVAVFLGRSAPPDFSVLLFLLLLCCSCCFILLPSSPCLVSVAATTAPSVPLAADSLAGWLIGWLVAG